MPTDTQMIFDDRSAEEGADGTFGSSNKNSLKSAFPLAIHHQPAPTTAFLISQTTHQGNVLLTREGYKKAYTNYVMSGIYEIPGSGFSIVDLDYGTNAGGTPPPPEQSLAMLAVDDNTIVSTGLGPNVVTLDITSVVNPGKNLPVLDGSTSSPAPFVSPVSTSPLGASIKIASGGIHGGPEEDSTGVIGKSIASVGEGD